MRKLILLVVVVVAVWGVWSRQRVYVRDPLGVVRRDGVKEQGAQVFINYSDDVLLENFNAPMYVTLIQRGEPVGTPAVLHCLVYVVCLTDADRATLIDVDQGAKVTSMSGKLVEYRDAGGRDTVVELR